MYRSTNKRTNTDTLVLHIQRERGKERKRKEYTDTQ